jgi:hypothetical protein
MTIVLLLLDRALNNKKEEDDDINSNNIIDKTEVLVINGTSITFCSRISYLNICIMFLETVKICMIKFVF